MTEHKHILLVENDPNDVELIMTGLTENNFADRVSTVFDGEEAIDYLFCRGKHEGRISGYPDVILLDLKLPKIDGLEVLKAIKDDDKLKYLPVVILTSSNEIKDIERGYRFGASGYIVKPIDFDRFIDVIKRIGAYWAVVTGPYFLE